LDRGLLSRFRNKERLVHKGYRPYRNRAIVYTLIETGNIAAVRRQRGHTNAAYFIQYARITDQELSEALDDR